MPGASARREVAVHPWGQFAVFAVYTAVLLVVGGILFRKRDA